MRGINSLYIQIGELTRLKEFKHSITAMNSIFKHKGSAQRKNRSEGFNRNGIGGVLVRV